MSVVGSVESLWRYPVKSMRGEGLEEAFVGFSGIYGDRLYAFVSSGNAKGFPYFTGREQRDMIRYRPRFRQPQMAKEPLHLAEAMSLGPGITPLYGNAEDLALDVETPTGNVLAIDDPMLRESLLAGVDGRHELTLCRSDRALTDCRPVSLLSIQTAEALGRELGTEIDKRRFRANIYVDLEETYGFAEDGLVGRTLRIGSKATVSILERDPRCKMITLDPGTAESDPGVLRTVAQGHDNKAGVYAAVLVEGTVRRGDAIKVLDFPGMSEGR